ncbi:hypothetical protein A1O7_00067 [Cladophialophora yegresii CBS 114405]|uniref:Clr5 domain-containing protein n=1 Tax=Cladophialophora yegresii CBS 114405 TaxID=1182544 RepID=W9W6L2_9EURO|nr:uncharacterized protein A1O7_00067 [Cladophialophora yegresii CBS 114405]EXJ63732.1 hypothetical protein A1O7_00067 [Cladophialophora yegresii CBS 114405]
MEHRSNARALPICEAEWDRRRSVIEGLYRLHELTDVIERMERDFGFRATDKQYKRQFARWGIRKNISSKDMKGVLGKPIENATVRGVQVPKAKIMRFERRQRLKASAVNRDQIGVQGEDLSRSQSVHQEQRDDHTQGLEVEVAQDLQENHLVSEGDGDTTIQLQQQIIDRQQQEIIKLRQDLVDMRSRRRVSQDELGSGTATDTARTCESPPREPQVQDELADVLPRGLPECKCDLSDTGTLIQYLRTYILLRTLEDTTFETMPPTWFSYALFSRRGKPFKGIGDAFDRPLAEYARLAMFGTTRLEIALDFLLFIHAFLNSTDSPRSTYDRCCVESARRIRELMSTELSDRQRRRIWAFTALKLAKHCSCHLNVDRSI